MFLFIQARLRGTSSRKPSLIYSCFPKIFVPLLQRSEASRGKAIFLGLQREWWSGQNLNLGLSGDREDQGLPTQGQVRGAAHRSQIFLHVLHFLHADNGQEGYFLLQLVPQAGL